MRRRAKKKPVDPERAAFLERRKLGIGGSDAPVVLGLSPGRSPLDLYAEKIGADVVDRLEGKEEVEIGREIEDWIAGLFVRRTGLRVRRRRAQIVHREHAFMRAHLDRIVFDPKRDGPGVLQIKNRDRFIFDTWEQADRSPTSDRTRAEVQLQHEIETFGASWGMIAVLFGGNRFRVYPFDRNVSFVRVLIEVEAEFWRCVEMKTPPTFSSNPFADARAIAALYPRPLKPEPIVLPPEAVVWDRQRRHASAAIARLERVRESASNRLKMAIGEHEAGRLPGGTGYRFPLRTKTISKKLSEIAPSLRGRVSKSSEYRELRFTKKLGKRKEKKR